MSFALGRKCYARNWTVTKLCHIGTGDFHFRFSAEKGISFSSAFSFTTENEKCIFGRPLHQTVSDYTLHQWLSNIQQSRFWTACRCLEKLVLPSMFDKSHPSSSSSSSSSSSRGPSNRCAAPWPMAISDLHSVDSSSSMHVSRDRSMHCNSKFANSSSIATSIKGRVTNFSLFFTIKI